MILQALYRYYETLVEKGVLSRPGWDDRFKVSFALDLNDEGELVNVIDLRHEEQVGKKKVILGAERTVPARYRRSAILSNFLCDNSSYLLGVDDKGKPDEAVKRFEACADFHRQLLEGVDSPAAKAILRYFERWDPASAATHPLLEPFWKDITGAANLIFSYDGTEAIKERSLRDAWQRHYDNVDPNAKTQQCLITGEQQVIAPTHPYIKGVRGTQAFGAALVSFDKAAFCSYGRKQNYNAPVGTTAAFGYTTALNYLLADREHCRTIGNTTIVCWAEHGDSEYQDISNFMMFGSSSGTVDDRELKGVLAALSSYKPIEWNNRQLDPGEHIYFLGLAPNAGRISVRFFYADTLQVFAERIARHYEDISIVRPSYDNIEYLSVWKLAQETVNKNSKDKEPVPQLVGDICTAILAGTPYPVTLINGVQLRIRAESEISRGRAAIIKGYYRRFYRDDTHPTEKEVFTVDLNEQSTYQPYVLGRLFSVLEAIQEDANPGINATIKDKYFNSASATPSSVMPLLLNLAQKHLRKLSEGKKVYYNRQVTELLGKMDSDFPARLSLSEQGAFQIGYYHQTQKRFTKKEEK